MTTQADADLAFAAFFYQVEGRFCIEQMFERLSVFATTLGYPFIAYSASTHIQKSHGGEVQTMSNYPAAWERHCLKEGYDKLCPIVTGSRSQSSPILWEQLYNDASTSDRERRIFDDAKRFGLKVGVTVPLRVQGDIFSVMSFVQREARETKDSEITYLQFAAWLFHLKVVNNLDCHEDHPRLTERETECLSWAAKGKSSWEISCILGISANTVNFHIKNAMRKLQCGNRIVAIRRAEKLGLIEAP